MDTGGIIVCSIRAVCFAVDAVLLVWYLVSGS